MITLEQGLGTPTAEPSAPAFDYSGTERTIIDRAEFARQIRKHGKVRVMVFVSETYRDEIVKGCAGECFLVEIPVKQALEHLARGNYDAHTWILTEYGDLCISFRVAPAWLQMARRREVIRAKIAREERYVASLSAANDPAWCARCLAELTELRRTLAEVECRIATRHATPAAA